MQRAKENRKGQILPLFEDVEHNAISCIAIIDSNKAVTTRTRQIFFLICLPSNGLAAKSSTQKGTSHRNLVSGSSALVIHHVFPVPIVALGFYMLELEYSPDMRLCQHFLCRNNQIPYCKLVVVHQNDVINISFLV